MSQNRPLTQYYYILGAIILRTNRNFLNYKSEILLAIGNERPYIGVKANTPTAAGATGSGFLLIVINPARPDRALQKPRAAIPPPLMKGIFMFYVEANANTALTVGSHAVERLIAERGAKAIARIEGPDSIGCYAVTLDNGDFIDVSRVEVTAEGFPLYNRSNIKAWLLQAIANAHKVRQTSATIADESQDIASLAA